MSSMAATKLTDTASEWTTAGEADKIEQIWGNVLTYTTKCKEQLNTVNHISSSDVRRWIIKKKKKEAYYYWSLLYSSMLRSWADSLRSHVILHEWIAFYSAFLNIHRSGVLTALAWLVPHETAAISARSVFTIQACTMSLHAKYNNNN